MNYYEKHIGDWVKDTVSLTMLEDGAYNRLIDQYYQSEKPLSLDKKLIYRLARANSSAERKAVDFVVETFFERTDEGYVQKRVEAELARYSEKRIKAQNSANARWNKSEGNANASKAHDASDMRTHSDGNAHQTPDTSHQTPDLKPVVENTHATGTPVRASELSSAMRRHSIEAQPGDPRIIAAAAAGVTVATIEAACVQAKAAKPNQRIPPNYVVQTAMNWTAEASAPRPNARASPQRAANHHDERAHTIAVLTGRSRDDNQPDEPYTIDAGHTRIG